MEWLSTGFKNMVCTTSDKQIQGLFNDFLRTKIFNKSGFFNPLWSPYWLKHVMESSTIFTSSATVDHTILYSFPQQDFAKWLGMTYNCV